MRPRPIAPRIGGREPASHFEASVLSPIAVWKAVLRSNAGSASRAEDGLSPPRPRRALTFIEM